MGDLKGKYPVVLSQKLIWGDMDAFQHINNTVYFRYFEDARMAYFDRAGIIQHMEETGIGPILASTRCDFRAPLVYPGRIQIAMSIDDLKPRRFTMNYLVYSEDLCSVVAEGQGLAVYYDYQRRESCEIPAVIINTINQLQHDKE